VQDKFLRLVAQVSNLLYRGFPIRWPWKTPVSPSERAVCRMEFGDTADWKSALLPGKTEALRKKSFCIFDFVP